MKKRLIAAFRRNEIVVVTTIIGFVFVSAMDVVAFTLKNSISTPPYETLSDSDLKRVFATGYLRFREDDGTSYLKIELHNGTLWWIKKLEFEFDGVKYSLKESDAFRPLHFGAVRCPLKKKPAKSDQIEYDLQVLKASGYPPAEIEWEKTVNKIAGEAKGSPRRN
jgi:hypothetical protein